MLGSAVAGRGLDVAAADEGGRPWTDGATIFVDPRAHHAEQVRMLCVQASLLAAGSLDGDVIGALARRPALTRRYLTVEGHRALAQNDAVLPTSVRALVDPARAAAVATPAESLAQARGTGPIADPPAVFGMIRPRRLLTATASPAASAATSIDRPPSPNEVELRELADEDDTDAPDVASLLSSPVGGGGPLGRLLRRLLRPSRGRGGGPLGGDSPTHMTRSPSKRSGRAATSVSPSVTLDGAIEPGRRGVSYPEWDVRRRSYRLDWCTVVEGDPDAGDAPATTMADTIALRRPLARLGVALTRCRRQPDGDDIDIDAVVEAHVDAIAGSPHDDDTYVQSLRRRRDLAVLVLLDVSGSTGQPGVGGKPVHEHQRSVASALTVALHELGDRVALYAFNSRGRTAVHLMRVKAFDDRLDVHVARRLAALRPAAYTRLGAAIRHGAAILEDRSGAPHRLLVVCSDGFAYDHGYDGAYGEADARRALVEARRRGLGCLCLSVGTYTDPLALRRVFGAAAHATVPRAEELPRLIGPLFRAALRSSEAKRRAFQRDERTRERLAIERSGDGLGDPAVLRARR